MEKETQKAFFQNLARFGDEPALIDEEGRELSYSELEKTCLPIEQALANDHKALVMVFCRKNIETIVGYLSALRAGHAVLLADAKAPTEMVERLITWFTPEYTFELAEGTSDSPNSFGCYALRRHRSDATRLPIHPDLALLLSTSGSTGSSKHARLSVNNIQSNASSIARYLGLTKDERPITNLPLHYSYGLSILNSHLSVGATILVSASSITQRGLWDLFKSRKGTSIAGVPYTYEMLKELGFAKMDLPSLRYMTQAGGKLRVELVSEFAAMAQRKGIKFFVMYGQTEATARISYLPAVKVVQKPESIGGPIPGGRIWLEDDQGRTIDVPDTNGEIVYCGPNVMMGYATERRDLKRGDELKGVLRTGDIARYDSDGDYYVVGRLKRFIKLLGRRINIDEVERALCSSGYECACGGTDDLLLVALTNMKQESDVKRFLLSSFNVPLSLVRLIKVNDLSRTASGKINYHDLFTAQL